MAVKFKFVDIARDEHLHLYCITLSIVSICLVLTVLTRVV